MSMIISALIPGAAYYYTNRLSMSFCVPLLGIALVALFSFTRWIADPYLFLVLNALLIGLHLVTLVHAKTMKPKDKHVGVYALASLVILTSCLIVVGHMNKSRLFGFELFHVPSASMSPTINVGDIVLSDTWFSSSELVGNEVIVFKRHSRGIVLLKRLQEVRLNDQSLELFVVGDNHYRSQDSRSFGWVSSENFIGVITGTLFSLNRQASDEESYPRRIK